MDQVYHPDAALKKTLAFASDYFEMLDTPVSLMCWLLINVYDDIPHLVNKEISADDYLDYDHVRFKKDFQAVSLLRKCDGLVNKDELLLPTMKKVLAAESMCFETNQRVFSWLSNKQDNPFRDYFHVMKMKIAEVLADFSPNADDCMFGPGASSTCKGVHTHVAYKLSSFPDAPQNCEDLVSSYLTSLHYADGYDALGESGPFCNWPKEYKLPLKAVCKFTTVPKDCRGLRPIAVEPHALMPLQKMYGAAIRRCLLNNGVQLETSGQLNGRRARVGSLDGSLATIDFSSASDTIARWVIKALLPSRIYDTLDNVRSSIMEFGTILGVDVGQRSLEKFSSMGNGFTFELESLIFYTAAFAVCKVHGIKTDISVHGDDVILPNEASIPFAMFCKWLGFSVNPEKSYYTGIFRESCGQYWFNGYDVKPFRLRELLSSDLELISVANRFRLFNSFEDLTPCDVYWVWRRLTSKVWKSCLKGPANSSDTVLWVHRSEFKYDLDITDGIARIFYWKRVYKKRSLEDTPATLALALYNDSTMKSRDGLSFRLCKRLLVINVSDINKLRKLS